MIKIYHNPKCKKSRAGLETLKKFNIEPEIIEYLKIPFSEEQLKLILAKLNLKPVDIIRTQEDIFKKQFKGKNFNEDEWIKILIEYPKLIHRPIIEKKNNAIIGDTVEKVENFIKLK